MGTITYGPFGTGLLLLAGGALRDGTLDTSAMTIQNNMIISADTTFPTIGNDHDLIFTGTATTLSGPGSSRTLTVTLDPTEASVF